MIAIRDAAINYLRAGWMVTVCCDPTHPPGECTVPRSKPCTAPGKAPVHSRWQTDRLTERRIIDLFELYPGCNTGGRLGKPSNLIDVECDTTEQEAALQELLDECNMPECQVPPSYCSNRGPHRLFEYAEGLPQAVITIRGVAFRCGGAGKGAQSVLPPSRHQSGATYRWLEGCSLSDTSPPPIPPKLVAMLQSAAKPQKKNLPAKRQEGFTTQTDGIYGEGHRHDNLISFVGRLHKMAIDGPTIHAAAQAWNIAHCSPPKPADVVAGTVEDIITRYPRGAPYLSHATDSRMFGSVPMSCYGRGRA
jgi:hypothetical protein